MALVRRRWALTRDMVLGPVVAAAIAVLLRWLVPASWPSLWGSLTTTGSPWLPMARLAVPTAALLTAVPHLAQPIRRIVRWLVVTATLATVALGVATPTGGAVAAVMMAMASAAVVHLAFGSCRGRPSLDDVAVALAGIGVSARLVGAATRQTTGLFLVDAEDDDGRPLVVKVYGRDAQDTQLVTAIWHTVWFREAGSPVSHGRLEQVEHEALVTLLAAQSGVVTDRVVSAGSTLGDALLVLRQVGRPLAQMPGHWSPEVVRRSWETLDRLHRAGMSHGQVDARNLVVEGDDIGLIDFRGATVAPEPEQVRTDEAQLLVATALGAGAEVAIDAAVTAPQTRGRGRRAAVHATAGSDPLAARRRQARVPRPRRPPDEDGRTGRHRGATARTPAARLGALGDPGRPPGRGLPRPRHGLRRTRPARAPRPAGHRGVVAGRPRLPAGAGHTVGAGDRHARRLARPPGDAPGVHAAAGHVLPRVGGPVERGTHRGERPVLPAQRAQHGLCAGRRRARRGRGVPRTGARC